MDRLARFFNHTVGLDMCYKPANFSPWSPFRSEDIGKNRFWTSCFGEFCLGRLVWRCLAASFIAQSGSKYLPPYRELLFHQYRGYCLTEMCIFHCTMAPDSCWLTSALFIIHRTSQLVKPTCQVLNEGSSSVGLTSSSNQLWVYVGRSTS